MNWAGLHPSVMFRFFFFFLITEKCLSSFHSSHINNLWQNGRKKAVLSHSSSSKSYEFPSHSQPWPKGGPAVQKKPFLKNLNAGPPAPHETGHECRAEPGFRPPPYSTPPARSGHVPRVRTCTWTSKRKKKTGGIQCVDVLLLFSLCGRWGWTYQGGRDGRGGTLVTESVLGWMGVLYNVELVNCVQWCRHDDIELLFLFYELTVSVIWITAISSEKKTVFCAFLWISPRHKQLRFPVCTQGQICTMCGVLNTTGDPPHECDSLLFVLNNGVIRMNTRSRALQLIFLCCCLVNSQVLQDFKTRVWWSKKTGQVQFLGLRIEHQVIRAEVSK